MKNHSEVLVFLLCWCAIEAGGAKTILKTLEKCSSGTQVTDMLHCAAKRIIRSLDQISAEHNIEIFPGVVLQSENNRVAKALPEENISTSNGNNKLLDLVVNATARFISGKTLKVKLPETTPQMVLNAIEEGRGKLKNKMDGKWMMGIGAAILGIFPFLLGGLALFATKALVIGKLALVISYLIINHLFKNVNGGGYNYLGGGGGGYNFLGPQTSYGVPGVTYGTNNIGGITPTGGYPYSRSFDVRDDGVAKSAQDLAYAAHK